MTLKKEADFRAKKLQNKDQYHNVFVGEVGYWLPWTHLIVILMISMVNI